MSSAKRILQGRLCYVAGVRAGRLASGEAQL
jgi:hypothetical protein